VHVCLSVCVTAYASVCALTFVYICVCMCYVCTLCMHVCACVCVLCMCVRDLVLIKETVHPAVASVGTG